MPRPLDFPGPVIDPANQCVIDEVEIAVVPLAPCECFMDCNEPGAPPPCITECFIFGPVPARGCDPITGKSLGAAVCSPVEEFLVKLILEGGAKNFLSVAGSTVLNTSLRFDTQLNAVVSAYVVWMVDSQGRRASATFALGALSVKEVNIPLADFVLPDTVFDFTQVESVYFGFQDNAQPSTCMLTIDNVRYCKNETLNVFYVVDDALPYGDDGIDDVCTLLEDFEGGAPELAHIQCDAPPPVAPGGQICDTCEQGPPLTEGAGAVRFCVGMVAVDPAVICRQFGVPFNVGNAVTIALSTNRPGMSFRFVLRDQTGKRARTVVMAHPGGVVPNQVFAVPAAFGDQPDGAIDFMNISEMCLVLSPIELPQIGDNYVTDDWRTQFGIVEGWNNLGAIAGQFTCGYMPQPGPPLPPMEPAMSVQTSPFTLLPRNMLCLTFNGPCTIASAGWDRGGLTGPPPVSMGAEFRAGTTRIELGFNVPTPANFQIDECQFVLMDDMGRRAIVAVLPDTGPVFAPGPALVSTVTMIGGLTYQPDRENLGEFDWTRVVRFELQVKRVGPTSVLPDVIYFDGFRIVDTSGPVTTFEQNFSGYANLAAFFADGGWAGPEYERRLSRAAGTIAADVDGRTGMDALLTEPSDALFTPSGVSLLDFGTPGDGSPGLGFLGVDFRLRPAMNPVLGMVLVGGPWNALQIEYLADPDADFSTMRVEIEDDSGYRALVSFVNDGSDLLVGNFRRRCLPRGSFTEFPGLSDNIVRVRLFKTSITAVGQTNPLDEGKARDQYDRAEMGLVSLHFFADGGCTISLAPGGQPGATGASTKTSVDEGMLGGVPDNLGPNVGKVFMALAYDGILPALIFPPTVPPGPPPPVNDQLYIRHMITDGTAILQFTPPVPINLLPNSLISLRILSEYDDSRRVLDSGGGPAVICRLVTLPGGFLDIPLFDTVYDDASIGPGPNYVGRSTSWGTMRFPTATGVPVGPVDLTNVTAVQLVVPVWHSGKTWHDDWVGDVTGPIVGWDTRIDLDRATFTNATNEFSLNKPLDQRTVPLVALAKNRSHSIAYWGQNEETLLAAEIVLVPAKYRNDPIVGVDGTFGFDENGDPLPGALEELARMTFAKFAHVAFKTPPFQGCRNIWGDLVYLDEFVCLGVEPIKREYEFFDSECQCFQMANNQFVADLVTHSCMDRILPDDGFQKYQDCPALPLGYPEAISFEYCGLPRLDRMKVDENANFKFERLTPFCVKSGDHVDEKGHFFVRVRITAKVAGPMAITWTDLLPPGHTLVNGVMAAVLNFAFIGEVQIKEYVLKTDEPNGNLVTITGSAQVVAQPLTLINLASDAIEVDDACSTYEYTAFGSQSPNIFGRVFWAGGGRPDPTVPPGVGFWTKVYAGQGSPTLSDREAYLAVTTTVLAAAVSHVFQVGGGELNGFAVGLPVWVFNSCFRDNPKRQIMCLDIEEEEALADPDEEVTGLYGFITAVDPILNEITVAFNTPPNQNVQFTTAAKAEIMVAPAGSKGFYWELSPALVDVCGHEDEILSHCIVRWSYRFWNSTQNPCPGTLGAAYVCDGDGESTQYELHGDVVKDILNPVDWIDLWCSPVREVPISLDALVGQDLISVCDICIFEPCDIVQIVDCACTGREGNGAGFVAAVVETFPLNAEEEDCDQFTAVEGYVKIDPPVPSLIAGCGAIDGFKTSRRARMFVKPDVFRFAISPTTKCDEFGNPIGGPNFVCVDFETGTFTFDPSVVANNPMVCYRSLQATVQLPLDEPGIYFLVSLDKNGCKSPPSKPIKLLPVQPPPAAAELHFAKCSVPVGATGISGGVVVPGTTVFIALPRPQMVSVHVTSGGLRASANGSLGAAFIRHTDPFAVVTDHQIGFVNESDGGDFLAQDGQASGFVCLDLVAGAHTFEVFGTGFGNPVILGPIQVLALAADPI